MNKRGQGATELLIGLSVGLIVLLIILVSTTDTLDIYKSKFREDLAVDALNEIENAAVMVYNQGSGARSEVVITLPKTIVSSSVDNQVISFTHTDGKVVSRTLGFNVSGSLPVSFGRQFIEVESVGGSVLISTDVNAVTFCGDGICDAEEVCSIDVTSCADTVCYNPSCSNGCESTGITLAVDAGECDEVTTAGSCSEAPCYCSGDSVCVSSDTTNYIDLWPYGGNYYPVNFTNLNSSGNTFWPIGANDGWDWKNSSYTGGISSLDNCVSFSTNDRIEIAIGDEGCSSSDDEGQDSGAYGIEFYVDSATYSTIALGGLANLSFYWEYEAMDDELDNNEDLWIKATIGNGTVFAYEDMEARTLGTDYNSKGGLGWNNDWSVSGAGVTLNSDEYSGVYSVRMRGSGTKTIDRSTDLSTATYPYVEFYAKAQSLESSDYVYFKVSSDDSLYTTLEEWTDGDEDDNVWRKYKINLTSYYEGSNDFWFLFETSMNSNNDRFFFDQIKVYEGEINYLGSSLDTSNQADAWNEIYWDQNPDSSASGFESFDVASYITGEGWYYLTLGAQVYKWSSDDEGANIYFDDVMLYVE
jgi:hypothetical protein